MNTVHAEAGIDGGGVFKEFLDALCKRMFDPMTGLFKCTDPFELSSAEAAELLGVDEVDEMDADADADMSGQEAKPAFAQTSSTTLSTFYSDMGRRLYPSPSSQEAMGTSDFESGVTR